jgi:hypothetical protein
MKYLSVILIALVIVVESVASKRSSTIPLNFFEAIQKMNTLLRDQPLFSSDQKRQINKIASNKDRFIIDLLEELTSFNFVNEKSLLSNNSKLPNITTECSLQLVQWFISITSKPPQLWALSGYLK